MSDIIKFDYDKQTVSARDLFDAVNEGKERFSKWFARQLQFGFEIGIDYSNPYQKVRVQKEGKRTVEREVEDYDLSIDMAKHICMVQKTEKAKQVRQRLIELENAWNTPEQVMARALKFADKTISDLKHQIEDQQPKVEYHDAVLNKKGLITTTVVAKDLGYRSAQKLNEIMNLNHIIFKNQSGTWCPYAEYEWLIIEGYADYQSYTAKNAAPCLKWTEKGRKWIIENYDQWVKNITAA